MLPAFVMLFPLLALFHLFGATGSCSVCLCSGKTSFVVFKLARCPRMLVSRMDVRAFLVVHAVCKKKPPFVLLFSGKR